MADRMLVVFRMARSADADWQGLETLRSHLPATCGVQGSAIQLYEEQDDVRRVAALVSGFRSPVVVTMPDTDVVMVRMNQWAGLRRVATGACTFGSEILPLLAEEMGNIRALLRIALHTREDLRRQVAGKPEVQAELELLETNIAMIRLNILRKLEAYLSPLANRF